MLNRFVVKYSFYAGKWWTGELVTGDGKPIVYENIHYHPSWRAAIDYMRDRIRESAD